MNLSLNSVIEGIAEISLLLIALLPKMQAISVLGVGGFLGIVFLFSMGFFIVMCCLDEKQKKECLAMTFAVLCFFYTFE